MITYHSMRDELEKIAESGSLKSKMPWYTASAGALLGSKGAARLVPKKYKLPAELAGALVGTGLGVEGGERLGGYLDKKAEWDLDESTKVLGKSLLGLGLGTGLGYGAAKLVGSKIKPVTAMKAMPYVGAALGLGVPLMHHGIAERMRMSHQKQREKEEARGGK